MVRYLIYFSDDDLSSQALCILNFHLSPMELDRDIGMALSIHRSIHLFVHRQFTLMISCMFRCKLFIWLTLNFVDEFIAWALRSLVLWTIDHALCKTSLFSVSFLCKTVGIYRCWDMVGNHSSLGILVWHQNIWSLSCSLFLFVFYPCPLLYWMEYLCPCAHNS